MLPINTITILFLGLYLLRILFELSLNRLNVSYVQKRANFIPEEFKDWIDLDKAKKILMYTVDKANLSLTKAIASHLILLFLLISGVLPWFVRELKGLDLDTACNGLLFFAAILTALRILDIPFSLYGSFGIEARYGFNRMTIRLWLSDLLKGALLAIFLGGILLWILLNLLVYGGSSWWLLAWVVLGLIELLLLWLYPRLIAPLFNRFEPIGNEELSRQIEDIAGKAGLKAKGIFRMDASRRSTHTNAYLAGIGRSKRIVLFDTLLDSHSTGEILAILAHEIGHWKKRHLLKHLLLVEILSLGGLYGVSKLVDWDMLYTSFGFDGKVPYVGLFLAELWISVLGYFVQPLFSGISRRFEREADDFSVLLMGSSEPLRNALRRMAADNLANLTPHPIYAGFYYSHMPLLQRITRLRDKEMRIRILQAQHSASSA